MPKKVKTDVDVYIDYITETMAGVVMQDKQPHGRFIAFENQWVYAINNSHGQAKVKQFKTSADAEKWLRENE